MTSRINTQRSGPGPVDRRSALLLTGFVEDEERQRVLRARERVGVDRLTLPNTVSSSGAVSPVTRATASMTPVMMPGSAVGSTTRWIDPVRGHAERVGRLAQARGTSLSISSRAAHDDRQHQDGQRQRAGEAGCSRSRGPGPRRRRMNRPATIDGTPVMTSTKKLITRPKRPLRVLDQVDRDQQAERDARCRWRCATCSRVPMIAW